MISWAFLLAFGLGSAEAAESLRAKEPPRATPRVQAEGKSPAVEPQEIWSLKVEGKPVAAFFDAASSAIFVSVNEGSGKARLDKISLEGKLEAKGVARHAGAAGPMRAYSGQIFWVAGKTVQRVDPEGGSKTFAEIDQLDPENTYLAIDRKGALILLAGQVSKFEGRTLSPLLEKENTKGLFLLLDKLFYLSGDTVSSVSLKGAEAGKHKREAPCHDCRYLERTSSGHWLSVSMGKNLSINNRVVLELDAEISHPAYVFRMDSTQDFFVLPLPEQGMLRAYRMPGTETPKKTDK